MNADLLVIGFGKGGKTLAGALGSQGWRVALVEQSPEMYGGTCINIACVPTKALIHDADTRPPRKDAARWYARAVNRKDALTAAMRTKNFEMLDRVDTVTVVTGRAAFIGPHEVRVTAGEDGLEIVAETIVINTGSVPIVPDIPGATESQRVFTSATLINDHELPRRLAIVGGGYIGLEFANMYAEFGSEVTLLEAGHAVLAREDDDVAEAVRSVLQDAGVQVITDARATAITDGGSSTTVEGVVHGSPTAIEADAVLFAVGRRADTDGLDVERAGVELTERGHVRVDDQLRTAARHIYAVGDVNGGPQFTYISLDDYRVVLNQLVGDGRRSTRDRVAVPHTLFVTPPLSTVGITEQEARASGRDLLIARKAVADVATMPRPKIVGDPRGLIKVVIDAASDRILGASLFCIDSPELVNLVALAMRADVTSSDLRDGIWMHPSTTEGLNEILGAAAPAELSATVAAT